MNWIKHLRRDAIENNYPVRDTKTGYDITRDEAPDTGALPETHADHIFTVTFRAIVRAPRKALEINLFDEAMRLIAVNLYGEVIDELHDLREMQSENGAPEEEKKKLSNLLDKLKGIT